MVISAARDHLQPASNQAVGEGASVVDHLLLVAAEVRLHGLAETDRLGGDGRQMRTALNAGEHCPVNVLGQLLLAQDQRATWAAQALVGGRRHHVGVRHRAGMDAGGDQAGDVRDVCHETRADTGGDF